MTIQNIIATSMASTYVKNENQSESESESEMILFAK